MLNADYIRHALTKLTRGKKEFLYIRHTVENNYISPSSTVGRIGTHPRDDSTKLRESGPLPKNPTSAKTALL